MNTTTKSGQHWSDGQIRVFVKSVRDRVGHGWDWITPDVRRSLIAEKALAIIVGQDKETIQVSACSELHTRMLKAAGFDD